MSAKQQQDEDPERRERERREEERHEREMQALSARHELELQERRLQQQRDPYVDEALAKAPRLGAIWTARMNFLPVDDAAKMSAAERAARQRIQRGGPEFRAMIAELGRDKAQHIVHMLREMVDAMTDDTKAPPELPENYLLKWDEKLARELFDRIVRDSMLDEAIGRVTNACSDSFFGPADSFPDEPKGNAE